MLLKLDQKRTITINNDSILIKPRWFFPDHYKIQYAENIGFISFGAGYQIKQNYEPTLYIGSPSNTFGNSSENVTTLSLKNSFRLIKKHYSNVFRQRLVFQLTGDIPRIPSQNYPNIFPINIISKTKHISHHFLVPNQ